MDRNDIFHPVLEAMTADQIGDHQAAHYAMDDNIRRMLGRLTLEQKRKVHETLMKMNAGEEGGH